MADSEIWNETDMFWSEGDFAWGDVYEVIAEVRPSPLNRILLSGRGNYKKERNREKEEKKFITILCIINDKEFSAKKYINKKLKVELFDEEVTIRQIKKVDISEANIKYTMVNSDKKELNFKLEEKVNKKIKIEVKNVKII